MHLYLQLTRSLAVTLIWLYCNKLVLRYVRLRVSDLGQVSIPQPGIVKFVMCARCQVGIKWKIVNILRFCGRSSFLYEAAKRS